MTTPRELVEGLQHNATASGNQQLEQRLADTALWFHENKDRIPRDDLRKREDFLEKGFWCLLEINVLLLQRLREERGSKMLYLPAGISARGDMRKFG